MDPHFSKKSDGVKKIEYHWSRDCIEKFISVSLNQSKTIDLQSLRKMSILIHLNGLSRPMLLLTHQPLLKVALKMKTFPFNAIMKFAQQEPLQHFFRTAYRPKALLRP